MAELGSVFEAESELPRGPDLWVTVEVPRAALGHTLRARVPLRLAAEGDLVERTIDTDIDDPEILLLHLPASLVDRSVLRLRSGGGSSSGDSQRGDLHVLCNLVERAPHADEIIPNTTGLTTSEGGGHAAGPDRTWIVLLALALVCALALIGILLG